MWSEPTSGTNTGTTNTWKNRSKEGNTAMSGMMKSLANRRDIARRERMMWRIINGSASTMRNELIEMRDRQINGSAR